MRVLFTTWAWPSHYYPQVPLAWALQAAGHEVRMTAQPDLLNTMLGSGLPASAIGRDFDLAAVHREAMDEVLATRGPVNQGRTSNRMVTGRVSKAEQNRLRAFVTLRESEADAHAIYTKIRATRAERADTKLTMSGEIADAMIDDLLALGRSWQPDLIVYDPLTYAGPLAAKLLGIPAVRNLFGPDVTYFATTISNGGLDPLLDRLGLDPVDLLGTATVDPCPASVQFTATVDDPRRIPMRYVPYHGMSDVPAWLSAPPQRPRICLTWGTSMTRLTTTESAFLPAELLAGCAKLATEREAELVLAITAAQRRLLPDLPDGVRVVESVPLSALLPTCSALFHQGGAGTLLTGLRNGLPQIIFPQLIDQAANALNVVTAGAGQTFRADTVTADTVLTAGHDLLDDPAYRVAALGIRQEILDQPSPADVVEDLVRLAESR